MDERREDVADEAVESGRVDAWDYLHYCPNCGQRLESRKCKARCFRCGFFQDCGDTII